MSDHMNKDELAYVKRVCPNISEEEQIAAAASIVPYFRAIPAMVDHLPKFQRPDAMSDVRGFFERWYGDFCPSWTWPVTVFTFGLLTGTLAHFMLRLMQ